jgi:type VI secretion system secreted protein VgrG
MALSLTRQQSFAPHSSRNRYNQANTGTCTEARHRQLQNNVDNLCKNSGVKSCRADKNPGMKKPEALENAQKFEACAAARDVINKECYGGGDAGHIAQANEARAAAKTCRAVP